MKDDKKTILAENLIRFRKQMGITQAAIASAVGIERSRYAHYEKDTTPTANILRKLAAVLNVTLDELMYSPEQLQRFNELDEPDEMDSFFFNELRKDEKELVMKLRLLDPTSKASIRKAVDEKLSKSEM